MSFLSQKSSTFSKCELCELFGFESPKKVWSENKIKKISRALGSMFFSYTFLKLRVDMMVVHLGFVLEYLSSFATPRPQFATRTMRILSRISKNSHRNWILLDFRIGDCEAQGAVIWCVVDRKSFHNNKTWKQMIIHHVRQQYQRFLKILTSILGWDFLISILDRKERSDVKIKLIFVSYAKFCINIDLGTYFSWPLL